MIAQKRLGTTDDRIIDIAFDCGFSDAAYFATAFKKTLIAVDSDIPSSLNKISPFCFTSLSILQVKFIVFAMICTLI